MPRPTPGIRHGNILRKQTPSETYPRASVLASCAMLLPSRMVEKPHPCEHLSEPCDRHGRPPSSEVPARTRLIGADSMLRSIMPPRPNSQHFAPDTKQPKNACQVSGAKWLKQLVRAAKHPHGIRPDSRKRTSPGTCRRWGCSRRPQGEFVKHGRAWLFGWRDAAEYAQLVGAKTGDVFRRAFNCSF